MSDCVSIASKHTYKTSSPDTRVAALRLMISVVVGLGPDDRNAASMQTDVVKHALAGLKVGLLSEMVVWMVRRYGP